MGLLKKFGDGYFNLCTYNCKESIEEFKKLPENHFNTGWVLTSIAKAYMEIVKYNGAAQFFEQAFKVEPHRI